MKHMRHRKPVPPLLLVLSAAFLVVVGLFCHVGLFHGDELDRIADISGFQFPRSATLVARDDPGAFGHPPDWIEAYIEMSEQDIAQFISVNLKGHMSKPKFIKVSQDEDDRHAILYFFNTRDILHPRAAMVSDIAASHYGEGICRETGSWSYRVLVDSAAGKLWIRLDYIG